MMFTATRQAHPAFIRYPRGPAEGVPIKDQPALLEIGKAEVLRDFAHNGRRKVALFALGNMMGLGREVAAQLTAQGHDVAIVNPRFFKPLDAEVTEFFGRTAEVLVTFEDHVLAGGYGSAVLELLNEKRITTPVVQVGWPDRFIEHATSVQDLRTKYGLAAENVVARVEAEFALAGPSTEAPRQWITSGQV
jgi:1-deoxy-D-xylulose-5-phosphate synthase